MKLAAIYNVFDGEELLAGSVASVQNDVDVFIFIVSTVGQSGEVYGGGLDAVFSLRRSGDVIRLDNGNELQKRNEGLDIARQLGCTHFILMDCDEYWHGLDRSQVDTVHPLYTYFKEPTLQLDPPESYYVPGICTLRQDTKVGRYPQKYLCDPTRKPNHPLQMGTTWMHHYSYVRADIGRKIRNSSARVNIAAKLITLGHDLINAKEGHYCEFYQKSLKLVPNYFDISLC